MSTSTTPQQEGNAAPDPHRETSTSSPGAAFNDELINILLVDDEPRNLTALQSVLEKSGYRLVCAESAEEALLALVAEEFALLVIDIQMPGMNGFELAQMIKQRKKTAGVPIIFLTAYYSEDRHVLEGYGTGAVDFLHKPINPAILRSKVEVFAELYRRSRETARANRALQNEVAARRSAEEQLRELNEELEQRVAERTAELLLREREMESLAENTPDMLSRCDAELRYVFVNSALQAVIGLPRGRILGRTMRDLGISCDLCDLWEEAVRFVFWTKKPRSIEFEHQGPAGARQYATRLVPEFGPSGEIEFVLGVTQDVTERKCAEEALEHAHRRKDEFLATLAHELRNPLAPLRTGLHILNLSQDAAVIASTREMMERQLSHMVRLIDDLLDVSRINSGKIVLRKEQVLLRVVVETALEASRPFIEASKHNLETEIPDQPVWLSADPTRLAQVITNLLTNAAKYTPEGGSIKLSAFREGDEVVIRVSDSGIGIPPGMLAEVFEMFTQVNRTLERSQGGLGIGLALVKRLVEFHGGTITAESPGIGLGSYAFMIRLPLVEAAADPCKQQTPAEVSSISAISGRRVLVVDDNVDGAESLASMLQIGGHEIRTAHSGPAAPDAARPFNPEVVFLDIGLPGMNGYEVARRCDEPSLSGALLVALTGWASDEDKRQSKEAGFDFHLTKPVELQAIERILAKVGAGGE